MCDAIDCAKCCTFFSIPSIVFLLIIGGLLKSQPLYIQGPTNYSASSKGCYDAAALYFATFVVSLGYWMYYETTQGRPWNSMFLSPPSDNQMNRNKQYGAVTSED